MTDNKNGSIDEDGGKKFLGRTGRRWQKSWSSTWSTTSASSHSGTESSVSSWYSSTRNSLPFRQVLPGSVPIRHRGEAGTGWEPSEFSLYRLGPGLSACGSISGQHPRHPQRWVRRKDVAVPRHLRGVWQKPWSCCQLHKMGSRSQEVDG